MILHHCGKFHTDTINQTVFTNEFVKLVWGKRKLFRATLKITLIYVAVDLNSLQTCI